MEYLDREGGKYLATKLKSYVDNKVTDLPSGTVDLTNYYTKEETDQLLANLPSGGTGTKGDKGDKGDAGVGISSIKSVNYELIITLTDGTVHNLGNIRGEKGAQGIKGTNGTNGVSPTVSVTETTNGHTVAITDVNGTQSFNVLNGKDGKDGASGGSSGGSAITYAYDTEIATGETWVDGKPIYLKVFHVDKLASAPSDCITYDNYFTDIAPFADKFISVEPLWSRTSNKNTFCGNVMQAFQPPYSENTSGIASCVKDMLSYTAWVQAWQGSSNIGITVCRGKNMWQYSVDVFVKYTKL